ncbi:MAG: TonB-dependent receptor [Culturomica sp.]|jgi:iron complex outermembrane receptor protein|nr:TonB-dependent receptor [Culturomica sp.]
MKKHAMTACLLAATLGVCAQTQEKDSLKTIQLQEVTIVSTRANAVTPVAYSNVSKEDIKKQNFGQDIPYLLSFTPSVLTTSDAGAGVGYTSIRIRGTDATRINVTTNGVPMNDAESHTIYWVNTPDLASSLQDMQIQRGAGTSTNGAGAFGGSINMRTQGISLTPSAEFSGSYGSFNTHKETVKVSTGIMNNRWGFDARISNIHSDGYRDRAFSDLKSFFFQGGYYGDKTSVKFITFGGKEETYHAWDGISKEMLKTNRKYNPNGAIEDADGNVTGFYDNQVDVFKQTHYQLLLNHEFAPSLRLNLALHYTDGNGYYEEYKNRRTLVEYDLQPFFTDGLEIKKSDLVRRKLVKSGFGGGIFSLDYKKDKIEASVGGGLNYYENAHYGRVVWVKNYLNDLSPDHEYYRNTGRKTDGNIYAKTTYKVTQAISLYADLQYRYLRYRISGRGDNWDWTATPEQMQQLNVDEDFRFFNPKAGVYLTPNEHNSLYASVSVAHKEPTRNNYTDNLHPVRPKAERMLDYEAGYTYLSAVFNASLNLYYMDYLNQLVLNGEMNDIGEPVTENVKNSYRTGAEIAAGAKIATFLRWDVNATLSRNRVKLASGSNPISFSPDFMANSLISFEHKKLSASLQTGYVGKQYLNNENDKSCMLDDYIVSNFNVGYTFYIKGIKSLNLGFTVYNIFNEMYESNGYASDGYAAYYPNAGINALAHVSIAW